MMRYVQYLAWRTRLLLEYEMNLYKKSLISLRVGCNEAILILTMLTLILIPSFHN